MGPGEQSLRVAWGVTPGPSGLEEPSRRADLVEAVRQALVAVPVVDLRVP